MTTLKKPVRDYGRGSTSTQSTTHRTRKMDGEVSGAPRTHRFSVYHGHGGRQDAVALLRRLRSGGRAQGGRDGVEGLEAGKRLA